MFAFRGRRAGLIKLIWHDGIGLCMLTKRLEHGQFVWPSADTTGRIMLTSAQLGRFARRLRMAGAGAATSTGIGRIICMALQQILAATRRHRSSLRCADRP